MNKCTGQAHTSRSRRLDVDRTQVRSQQTHWQPLEQVIAAELVESCISGISDEENWTAGIRDLSCTTTNVDRKAILESIRACNSGANSRTQCTRLLEAIRRLGSVTTFEASRYLDIYHPPARKRDLVRSGYPIQTGKRLVCTESGDVHRIGEYLLATTSGKNGTAGFQLRLW